MKIRQITVLAVMVVAIASARTAQAQRVTACPDPNACAEIAVTPAQVTSAPGQVATVGVSFRQAPDDGHAGGPDEVAAIAVTLGLQGGKCSGGSVGCLVTSDCPTGETCTTPATTALTLADCTIGSSGLPAAVKPTAAASGFRVVIENATCGSGRTHCLCPDAGSGINADSFINLVVFGPDPLPTPGPNPVVIPKLPSAELLTIDLRVADGATLPITLHPYNQVINAQRPQSTAFFSMGDVNAVDTTCAAVTGEPPCAGPTHVSQVVAKDATIASATPVACVGDCNNDGEVFGNEVTIAINIVAGSADLSACNNADANGDGEVFGNEVTLAILNVANGCPQ